jgi:para-nitrobenzyl esterase
MMWGLLLRTAGAATLCRTAVASMHVIRDTESGPVLGVTETEPGSGRLVNTFRGIPFAASTAGSNRFMPPRPRAAWGSLPLNCTANGPGCVQPHHNEDVPCDGKPGPRCQSEDCLNLNVYCPAAADANSSGTAPAAGYPVMFWIYGGAFNEGMNWGPLGLYDGTKLAARGDVCVVATNYRLGVLGFLVTDTTRGNQAIQDQRAAMEWTARNIHKFGGNPAQVTIWGQSAGAMSVAVHLVSPASRGLFHGAIMESNVAAFHFQKAAHQRLTYGAKFAELAGCGTVANLTCLQGLSARAAIGFGESASGDVITNIVERLLEGGDIEDALAMQWSPVVDIEGSELRGQPLALIAAGKVAKVPLLLGTNQDEAATFIYAGVSTKLPELLFKPAIDAIFRSKAVLVNQFYTVAARSWRDTRDSLSDVLTDYWFKCPASNIAANFAAAGLSTFVYRFQHVVSFASLFPRYGLPTVCETRSCHAAEVPFVFGNTANYSFARSELPLSDSMIAYWTAFARTGDVNVPLSAVGDDRRAIQTMHWPRFNRTVRLNMRLATSSDKYGQGVESSLIGQPGTAPNTSGVCEFFDQHVGYSW